MHKDKKVLKSVRILLQGYRRVFDSEKQTNPDSRLSFMYPAMSVLTIVLGSAFMTTNTYTSILHSILRRPRRSSTMPASYERAFNLSQASILTAWPHPGMVALTGITHVGWVGHTSCKLPSGCFPSVFGSRRIAGEWFGGHVICPNGVGLSRNCTGAKSLGGRDGGGAD
jgi:hypothetical protein